MVNILRKYLSLIIIVALLIFPVTSFAQETPQTPSPSPSAPATPTPPPPAQTPPPSPTPPASTQTPPPSPTSQPSPTPPSTPQPSPAAPVANSTSTTQPPQNGITGDPSIHTGDANSSAYITTTGNTNNSSNTSPSKSSAISANNANGADSTNSATALQTDQTNTNQTNDGTLQNNASLATVTGRNSASTNVGNSSITSGNANTSATAVTNLNTNASNVQVAEFNVADDQKGDLVLDFAQNCIIGCQNSTASASASNRSNGTASTNDATTTTSQTDVLDQLNNANLGNTLNLSADTGLNNTNDNVGSSTITTGDANVSANALTLANNNVAGKVLYGVVNIYGDLEGDIVLPESVLAPTSSALSGTSTTENQSNGASSQNTAAQSILDSSHLSQTNDAQIDNNLNLSANTGQNIASGNTGADTMIKTGNTTIDANVVNIANSNVDGGDLYLVFVNKAGQWIGKILGSPDGSTMAGSAGMEFSLNDKGEVVASNSGNGSSSQNNATANASQTSSTNQSNVTHLTNTLNLSANTGQNSASRNTNGTSKITTGDAKVIANIVNFVNNNIASNHKLIVTVVNVFGSWIGDFVTPDHPKTVASQPTTSSNQPVAQSQGGQESAVQSSDNSSDQSSLVSDSSQLPSTLLPEINQDSQLELPNEPSYQQTNQAVLGTSYPTRVAAFKQLVNNAPSLTQAVALPNAKTIKVNLAYFIIALPCIVLALMTVKKLRPWTLLKR